MRLFRRKTLIEKSQEFAKLENVYTDSKGRKYYSYPHDMDIPILRMIEIQKVLVELGGGLAHDELFDMLKAIDANIDKTMNSGKISDLAESKFLINEMTKIRKDIVIHDELFLKLVATYLIREDESPVEIDHEIISQKVETFREESRGKSYVFFYGVGLSRYIPYLSQLKDGWEEYSQKAKKKIAALKEMSEYILSEQKLSVS